MVKNLRRGSEGVKLLSVNGENTIDIPIEIVIDPSQAKQQPGQIEEAGNLFLFGFGRDDLKGIFKKSLYPSNGKRKPLSLNFPSFYL
jgi:hypothetical protein